MTVIASYFDENGLSESRCTNFQWIGDHLDVEFSSARKGLRHSQYSVG